MTVWNFRRTTINHLLKAIRLTCYFAPIPTMFSVQLSFIISFLRNMTQEVRTDRVAKRILFFSQDARNALAF